MPLSRAIAPLLAAALALCACPLRSASALEAECSACEVVAAALASRVAAEGAQTVLDLRGRLGPQAGQRKGKRLAWRGSETRLAALLEGLCDSGSLDADYAVRRENKGKTAGLPVIPHDDADEDDDEDEEEEKEVLWLRRGEDNDERGFERVTEAREKDSRAKELEGWCGRLVSEVEEGLARELAGGGSGSGSGVEGEDAAALSSFDARAALCERLTRSCAAPAKREEEAKAAPSSPSSKNEEKKRSWRGKKKKQQQREEL